MGKRRGTMKTRRKLENRKRRTALRISLLVILACCFFRWFSIDLPDGSGLSFSGYNMMLGKGWADVRFRGIKMSDAISDEGIAGEIGQEVLEQVKGANLLEPSFLGIASFIMILASVGLTFRTVRSGPIIATILVFISFIVNFAIFAYYADEVISFAETVLTDFSETTQTAYDYTTFFAPLYIAAVAYVASLISGIAVSIGRYTAVPDERTEESSPFAGLKEELRKS